MKTVYGSIHMSPGVVTFTDEFLGRLKELEDLIQAQAGAMRENDQWSERALIKISYGIRGPGEGLARYITGHDEGLGNTIIYVDVTKDGSFPYSFHEEGQESIMGFMAPSLEEAPDVFFAKDLVESGAYIANGIKLMCKYSEIGPLLATMPTEHRALFDDAVGREVEANFNRYREMWLESFEIMTRTDIDELRNNGHIGVAYDPASVPDDVLASLREAFRLLREQTMGLQEGTMGSLELFALTTLPSRTALEYKCRRHGLRFNHCALGLTPPEKIGWCKSRGVKAIVDHDEAVKALAQDAGIKFISMRALPEVPAEHARRG